jgi:hypothetical protein
MKWATNQGRKLEAKCLKSVEEKKNMEVNRRQRERGGNRQIRKGRGNKKIKKSKEEFGKGKKI